MFRLSSTSLNESLEHIDWEFEFLGIKSLPKIIGLTGPTKCGKTIIAKRLATEYGFYYLNLGSILSKLALTMGGIDLFGMQLGKFGRSLREQKGTDILSRLAFRILRAEPNLPDKIILDSLLHPEEISFFQKRSDLILIGVEADTDLRCFQLMGWSGISADEAKRIIDERDKHEQYHYDDGDEFRPNIDKCLGFIEKLDSIIRIETAINNRTTNESLDRLMERLSKEWSLQRTAAPMSNNNYPFWNQKLSTE